ncbi:hypothetical protein DVH24_000835 [Malus domestica]|uniref:Pentacotripeptide-repeat region of PRORP domain-containing protein n=1 Tax=Malus domestica TaxID=3750 RepID=A0A498JZ47_MALDO|nr:hypothetical protein DVH24_000835 [Malus domestica]
MKRITTRTPFPGNLPSFIFTILQNPSRAFHSDAVNANPTCTHTIKQTHLVSESMIQTRCKSGKIRKDEALVFCAWGVMKGYACNEITYATMISGLCKQGKISKALETLKKMWEDGRFEPKQDCYNPITDSLCKESRMDEALTLFRDMISKSVVPDIISYNSLIHGLCNMSRWEEVLPLFEGMEDHGVRPDVVTYTTLVYALCQSERLEKAKSFLICMFNGGISPDVYTYSVLINALCKDDRIQEALSLFGTMTEKRIKPDVVTFTSLISASCKSGNWEEGVRLFKTMIDYGALPNIITYNSVLDALCKEGKTAEALNLVEEMFCRGEKPDVVTYSSLIKGLCRTSQWREATRLFDEILCHGISPDCITLTILSGALRHELHRSVSFDLKEQSPWSFIRTSLTASMYLYVLTATERSERTVTLMKMKRITTRPPSPGNLPSFIFTILRNPSRGFHSDAVNANPTCTHRIKQTHLVSESMIQTRCKSGRIRKDEALGYFNSMIQTKPLPSIWTLNYLLGALSKMKEYSAVVSMCKQLMGCAQFRPDVCTINIFLNCLCRLNRMNACFSILSGALCHEVMTDEVREEFKARIDGTSKLGTKRSKKD